MTTLYSDLFKRNLLLIHCARVHFNQFENMKKRYVEEIKVKVFKASKRQVGTIKTDLVLLI